MKPPHVRQRLKCGESDMIELGFIKVTCLDSDSMHIKADKICAISPVDHDYIFSGITKTMVFCGEKEPFYVQETTKEIAEQLKRIPLNLR